MISGLGTADFIVTAMKNVSFAPGLVPAALFLFGAFVSFSTGSSWGTFAIMMPLAIPMAHSFSIPYAIAVGAVLSGGLFGEHCSPISDTTILSATGAECDLVAHVKTQLPYACVTRSHCAAGLCICRFYRKYVFSGPHSMLYGRLFCFG